METVFFGNLIEDFHRFATFHECVACRNRYGFVEGERACKLNGVSQGLGAHIVKIGSYGIIMICRIDIQVVDRFDIAPEIKVLEAWRETANIVAQIEENHRAIELVVRPENGVEASHFIVENKAKASVGRHGKILVAAQKVIACSKIVFLAGFHINLRAGHERVNGHPVFFLAHLVIERAFKRPVFRPERI